MFQSYDDALQWLFLQSRGGEPRSLTRMKALWQVMALDSPPACIYVVGTNGKGSVATMLATALSEEGFRTGCFSSPHVSDFRERICLNGRYIPREKVFELISQMAQLRSEPKPAFFELCFALALRYFKEEAVSYAVIEAGVGAKLDATNVLENIKATVITNVSLDHQNTLGKTLQAIAADKAEAIRTKTPVFTAARAEALEVIAKKAAEQDSPLIIIPPQPHHHDENKALVRACLESLKLSEQGIEAGLKTPQLPARLERFFISGRSVILDGGHNPEAVRALCNSLDGPVIALFSAKHSKDARSNLEILSQKASTILLTSILGERPDITGYPYYEKPSEALNLALADSSGLPIVISGSFYLAGELRPILLALSSSSGPIAA